MSIDQLEKQIKYKFKNVNLLKEALTHSSYNLKKSIVTNKNYERLEFLGDRVLGLVLAEYFFRHFPSFNEGSLNDYLQKYANQSTLAEYANNINLSIFLKIQKGDNLDNNKSILSDVVESIIGAIYLDSDLVKCKNFILNQIVQKHSFLPKPIKHPKSTLQEYCLDKYKTLPKYTMINKSGTDHLPTYIVSVSIKNIDNVSAAGTNLKNAEEAAALKLLNILRN